MPPPPAHHAERAAERAAERDANAATEAATEAAEVQQLAARLNGLFAAGAEFAAAVYIYGAAPWRPGDTSVYFKRAAAEEATLVIETTAPYFDGRALDASSMVFRITRPRDVTLGDGGGCDGWRIRVRSAEAVPVDGETQDNDNAPVH